MDKFDHGEALAYAIRRLGGFSACARAIVDAGLADRMTPQNVFNWLQRGSCPPKYAVWLEQQTGVPREELVNEELAALVEGLCDCPTTE